MVRLDYHRISGMLRTTLMGGAVSTCPMFAVRQISDESCLANARPTKVVSKIAVYIGIILVFANSALNAETIISVTGPHGSTLALEALPTKCSSLHGPQ